MPWRGPEVPNEIPTLGLVVGQWIQDHCVVPDREMRGRAFILTPEQVTFLVYHYALTLEGKWRYPRGSQLMRPQKWGKGPLVAAICCAEAAGPVLFDGWDEKGEPVGKPWATPHIQVTAGSEDQTANTWRALQPMIELGPLGESFIPDTGLTRINLPGGGLIEPVTASARSRLGQRITFAVQDETHSWNRSNHGLQLADNQRRNLAGVGGRFVETTNAFDPVEQSVAQRTQAEPGVYIDDVDGGAGSVRNKQERRKVMRKVYGDSCTTKGGWVDLDRIDGAVSELIENDKLVVWRAYCDDQYIAHLIESWQNRFGQKRFVTWHTNRQRQIAWAVRRYEEAISSGDVSFDGNPIFMKHMRHARKRMLTVLDDKERQMHTISKSSIRSPLKVDAAMAAVLSWEARSDALASGAVSLAEVQPEPEPARPRGYEYNYAPPVSMPVGAWQGGMHDME